MNLYLRIRILISKIMFNLHNQTHTAYVPVAVAVVCLLVAADVVGCALELLAAAVVVPVGFTDVVCVGDADCVTVCEDVGDEPVDAVTVAVEVGIDCVDVVGGGDD